MRCGECVIVYLSSFSQATKAGFTLGDVSRAPLAKRRKRKRGTSPHPPPPLSPPQQTARPNTLELDCPPSPLPLIPSPTS